MERAMKFIQTSQELAGMMHRMFEDKEVTKLEYIILNYLNLNEGKEEECVAKKVAADLDITKPLLSRYIKSLEGKKLIKRHISRKDRRYFVLELTAAGKEKAENMRKISLERVNRFLDFLGEEDAENLIRILEKAKHFKAR